MRSSVHRFRIGEHPIQSKFADAAEMAHVAGHELEPVVKGGGCNLKVSVSETLARQLELGTQPAEYLRNRCIVGQDGHRWQYTILYVVQMTVVRA